MAENVLITPGTGDTIGADEITSVKYQRVKLIQGVDGTNDGDVAATAPLNVACNIGNVDFVGGAGAVAAGVQRTTLASDDPAVALLTTIDSDTNTIQTDTTSIDGKITACDTTALATSAKQLADGHNVTVDNVGGVEVVQVTAADLNVTEASAAGIKTDTAAMVVDLAAIEVTQGTIAGDTTSIDGKITACDTGAVVIASGTVTAVTDITNTVTVDGTVTANPASGTIDTVTAVTAISNALPAGTNLLGKVGIDQTTDGTTNKVSLSTDTVSVDLGANNDVTVTSGDITADCTSSGDVPITLDGETVAISNDSIVGAGDPVIDSYATAAVNCAADTASQELVAIPGANKQIWVYGLVGTVDVAGSVALTDEDDTALSGIMPVGITGGFVMNPCGNFGMPWIKCTTNKALDLDTVTCTFDGIITYAIVSV